MSFLDGRKSNIAFGGLKKNKLVIDGNQALFKNEKFTEKFNEFYNFKFLNVKKFKF